MNFKEKQSFYIKLIEEKLANSVAVDNPYYTSLKEAMLYSLTAGGKRLRPTLALATGEIFGTEPGEVIAFACAIEMIHTYSLIHDDLPAMDNDDYRRGKLTNHKMFGEAMAILAGDALLNLAYETMLRDALAGSSMAKLRAMEAVARYAGARGMIGGQVIDLQGEGRKVDSQELAAMHRLKTGALIKAPVEAAAIISGAGEEQLSVLSNYAANLGLAFQIKDDILDVEGSMEEMGKRPGNDAVCNKSTYITLYGLEQSKRMLQEVTDEGIAFLEGFGSKADFLRELARALVRRSN
ncbi:farnesyl diphosphate synthase [Ruminiclostridium hungatei]|uniref:Farnesyl diphosphate synthase n=1 Tax=Ruminiclostridium hungatei TaxID=48256 RepID=A0A1V4SIY9_RUMHU|nr:farnesyl diphosphate synthase [Ruminiclostridium hungatei]OPX43435.1 farnesyl diphosphate synthase [Ruminiclostridium hungatei]